MNTKFLTSVFVLLFLVGIASAVTITGVPSSIDRTSGSFTVEISSTNLNDAVTLSVNNISDSGKTIVFSANETSFTLDNESKQIIISYTVPSDFVFTFGEEYKATLQATASNSSSDSETVLFTVNQNACSGISNFDGDLDVEIRDISVSGLGDEDEWFPFDEVEVEVRIENNGNDDIEDIQVEWGLWDDNEKRWVIEMDELDEFDLNDDDEEILTFTFTIDDDMDVDLEDLNEGTYILYVTARGDVDTDSGSEDTCEYTRESSKIVIERDFVVLTNLEIPQTINCDSNVHITGEVWNVGSRNQDDVSVLVQNSQLGLNKVVSIGDIDSMESEDFNFDFELNGASAGTYSIRLTVLDEDDDVFENENDDESVFNLNLVVSGNCGVSDDVSVSAVLEDGGQAGKPLTVKATVTNEGDNPGVFTLNIANYASWAELSEVSQNTLTLDAGSSEEVLITLDVKSDASGEEVFNVEVLSNDKLVANQPVSVTIKEKTKIFNLINADNWQIWAIAALNVLLIVIIIIVAIRIARK